MKIRFFVSLLVFLLSYFLSIFYTNGDQSFYSLVYNELNKLGFIPGYLFYVSKQPTIEVGYFSIIWVASKVIEKNIFMALSNATLAFYTMRLFKQWGLHPLISYIFVLTNFYVLVLYVAAEKLKFSFLFLILSLNYFNKLYRFFLFGIISIFSHVSIIIYYFSYIFNYTIKELIKVVKKGTISKRILYVLFFGILSLVISSNYLSKKILQATEMVAISPYDFLAIVCFSTVILYYEKNKLNTYFILLPFYIATLTVGSSRINMLAYFLFFYFITKNNRGVNIPMFITLIYLFIKSIFFVINIITTGDGFLH